MTTRPRSLFKHRARERAARLRPGLTWRDALQPGRAMEVRHWHDAGCRRPQGEPCSCANGPDVELIDLADPRRN